MLKKQKRYLYLDDEEISVMLQSLIRLKDHCASARDVIPTAWMN